MKIITGQAGFQPEYDMRSICPLEEMLLFDIETTGLKKETSQVYLIGCAWYENGNWILRQYLTENAGDEYDILQEFTSFAERFRMLVHFNGDSFDIPYLRYKCEYYGIGTAFSALESFDIYRRAKRARHLLGLSSMSQKSIEQFLGIERDDRYSGGLLIPVYFEYEKTGSEEAEQLLLLHNHDDLQGMLKIMPVLSYTKLLEGAYFFVSAKEEDDNVVFRYRTEQKLPAVFECRLKEDLLLSGSGGEFHITRKLKKGIAKLPLPNVSDYYYLPEEDRVIHKDVAQFLDRSRRVKATAKNCFVRKEGRFLPDIHSGSVCTYYFGEDRKTVYADWEELSGMLKLKDSTAQEILTCMAKDILDLVSCL